MENHRFLSTYLIDLKPVHLRKLVSLISSYTKRRITLSRSACSDQKNRDVQYCVGPFLGLLLLATCAGSDPKDLWPPVVKANVVSGCALLMDAAFWFIPMLFKGTDTVSGVYGGRLITLCSDIPYPVGKRGPILLQWQGFYFSHHWINVILLWSDISKIYCTLSGGHNNAICWYKMAAF